MEYATEEHIRSMFPPLSEEEMRFMNNLPDKVQLEVPFVYQEEKHWSGNRCSSNVTPVLR